MGPPARGRAPGLSARLPPAIWDLPIGGAGTRSGELEGEDAGHQLPPLKANLNSSLAGAQHRNLGNRACPPPTPPPRPRPGLSSSPHPSAPPRRPSSLPGWRSAGTTSLSFLRGRLRSRISQRSRPSWALPGGAPTPEPGPAPPLPLCTHFARSCRGWRDGRECDPGSAGHGQL